MAGKINKRFRCPLCKYDGSYGRLALHLRDVHNTEPLNAYIKYVLNDDVSNALCQCGCGELTKWTNWKVGFTSKFLRGHNAQSSDPAIAGAFKQPKIQKKSAQKRSEGYKAGKYQVWNKGLSGQANEKIRLMQQKAGETLRKRYETGELIPWQKLDPVKHRLASEKAGHTKRLAFKEIQCRINELPIDVSLLSTDEEYKSRQFTLLRFRCNQCGDEWEKTLKNIEDCPRCFTCNPQESYNQIEIYDFISSLVGKENVSMSDRIFISPQEIDILAESHGLGIEYNGLPWHTDQKVPPKYHDMKTQLCRDKGVTLVHVFSDEWKNVKKQLIIKSMICSRLGKSAYKIGARQCTIRKLAPKQRIEFFENNHLDGDVKSKIAWGLFDKQNNLVFALSLRRPYHKKYTGKLEIARCATKINHSIPGAVSRLVVTAQKWAISEGYDGLISYVDTRHGNGESYKRAGFEEIGVTPPRFWWTDHCSRYDRFKFRADRSRNMSEKQVAKEAGVVKIYGCSNRVLSLNFST